MLWAAVGLTILALTAVAFTLFRAAEGSRPHKANPVVQAEPDQKSPPLQRQDSRPDPTKAATERAKESEKPPEVIDEAGKLVRRVLAAINAQRSLEGRPDATLDAGRSTACREHANYLAKNSPRPYLDPHDQEADLPGATPAGRLAARSASVVWREPVETVNAWLSAPAHRALLLDAGLASVGVGFARRPRRGRS